MAQIRVLSAADIERVFNVSDALVAVEAAYQQKAQGTAVAWPMVYEQFDPGVADMDIRSGDLGAAGIFGLKLTAWFSKNPAQGLPEVYGTVLMCSDTTGEPLALLNGSAMTGLRTGAAAALGAKWLAKPGATVATLIGTGHQAPYQAAALLAAVPTIQRVYVYDPLANEAPSERAIALAERASELLSAAGLSSSAVFEATLDASAAVGASDVVITVTPASQPVLLDAWVSPGTHISAVGADMPGKQELENALVARATLFADDAAQTFASGEFEVAAKQGAITPADLAGELGQVIAGKVAGRTSDEQITVFDTSGIAVQDLASAQAVYERAVELGLGTVVEL